MSAKITKILALLFVVCGHCNAVAAETIDPDTIAGAKLYRQDKFDEAIGFYNRAIKRDPKNERALCSRAECFIKLKKFDEAIADCQKAVTLQPLDPYAHRVSGFANIRSGHLKEGVLAYTHALQLNPADNEARTNRAIACKMLGIKEPPVVPIKASYKPSEILKLATDKHNQGHYGEAVKLFTTALLYDDKNAETYFRRGESYFAMDKYQECINDCSKAIKLNSKDYEYFYSLGKSYTYLNQNQKALENFLQVEKMVPLNKGVHMRLGGIYLALGNLQKAIDEYSIHIQLVPRDDKVVFKRADLYRQLKKYPQAIADYNSLIALHPTDEDPYRLRGEIYLETHDYQKAIADFSKTIDLDRANAGSVYRLRAKAYQAIGKQDLASYDLKHAKEFDERDRF